MFRQVVYFAREGMQNFKIVYKLVMIREKLRMVMIIMLAYAVEFISVSFASGLQSARIVYPM